jgi:hypothetical protein
MDGRSGDLGGGGLDEALAWQRDGRLAEAAELCLQAGDTLADPAQIVPGARLLLLAGRPFEAEKWVREVGGRFADAPESKLARALVAVHLGRLEEARSALEALAEREHESLWMDYLVVRFELLVSTPEPRPREWIDRLLAEGDRYPEFFLVAAEWAERNGERGLELEAYARFAAVAGEEFSIPRAHVRAWLEFRERFPSEFTVEREPVVVLPMRTKPVPMVEFSINGAPPVWLVVDTGASNLVLDAQYAREVLKLPAGPRVDGVWTATGRVGMETAHVETVTAAGLKLANLHAGVVDWSGLGEAFLKAATSEEENEIGRAFLEVRGLMPAGGLARDAVVWFDVEGERLVIAEGEPDAGLQPKRSGFERSFGEALPHAPFRFAEGAEGLLLLDTGKTSDFVFEGAWLRGSGVEGGREEEVSPVLGLGGVRNAFPFSAPDFSLWELLNFREVTAGVSTVPFDTPYVYTSRAGLVGWAVLSEFSPRFDYRRSKVTFFLPAGAGE